MTVSALLPFVLRKETESETRANLTRDCFCDLRRQEEPALITCASGAISLKEPWGKQGHFPSSALQNFASKPFITFLLAAIFDG
jgi:hypothetical protein